MFEGLISQSGAISMLPSVTLGPMVLVDMTTSGSRSQCCYLEKWRRSHKRFQRIFTSDADFELQVRIQIGEGSLRNIHILAMSTDFRSGVAESAGWAAEKVGKEAFGELDGTEEKRPKQSSGQVVRR